MKKILLIPDHPGWAFDHRAKDLLSFSFSNFRLELIYRDEIDIRKLAQYDLLYPMSISLGKWLHKKGIPYQDMASAITSVRVYEKYWTDKGLNNDFLDFICRFRGINAWSEEITNTFSPYIPIYKTRIGINSELFTTSKNHTKNKLFTVGWVGRIDKKNYRNLKGYDIVLEAIKGANIKLDIRTFKEKKVSRDEMVSFYHGLDCFVCSSESEGLPNPVLEAASCGVPIISTNVGIVPELIKHNQNGLIVSRNAASIRKAILDLKRNPSKRKKFSKNIRRTIKEQWTWDHCKQEWEQFFQTLASNPNRNIY
ncbi:glycosyltransferase family 4 protein [Evansella tamaricis]|uniref:Glycosyltransferase family 4 protein n=1 Tax=Evansella tamaricis TaxID=2069301 RepID=A0ABS6JIF1_9BACI|nr:glycosyltransferase family 4 protein [Evansella tamaricis]MBU9713313.1 glycosyltransferase family 4 protein [Evansella tamaricis]